MAEDRPREVVVVAEVAEGATRDVGAVGVPCRGTGQERKKKTVIVAQTTLFTSFFIIRNPLP